MFFVSRVLRLTRKRTFLNTKKPEGEIIHHDVCVYTLAPGELALYKEYYPLLDGESRKVAGNTSIQIHLSKDIQSKIGEARIKLYNDEFEFYKSDFKQDNEEVIISTLNSNMFTGNATLLLELIYSDDKSGIYKFYFEKEDTYSDIKLADERGFKGAGIQGR